MAKLTPTGEMIKELQKLLPTESGWQMDFTTPQTIYVSQVNFFPWPITIELRITHQVNDSVAIVINSGIPDRDIIGLPQLWHLFAKPTENNDLGNWGIHYENIVWVVPFLPIEEFQEDNFAILQKSLAKVQTLQAALHLVDEIVIFCLQKNFDPDLIKTMEEWFKGSPVIR
jgi:hypothetical protein